MTTDSPNEAPETTVGQRLRPGGLMRCCIASIQEYDGAMVAGETVIGCNYETDPTAPRARIADDGVWEWVGPSSDGTHSARSEGDDDADR